MPHESLNDDLGMNPLSLYRAFAGTGLIVIGVIVGVYVALAAFKIIDGDDPPAIINRFAEPAAERVLDEAGGNVAQALDVSSDLKQIILYTLAFLFLVLPAAIATSLIGGGAKLLQGDAGRALTLLVEKLKQSS